MTTSTQNLIDQIRRDYLSQGRVEPRNKLSTSITDTDTTLTFTYDLGAIVDNARLSIGLEDMYIWSTDATARTADVDRGIDGTTAASHTTTEVVRVNPRWTDAQILRAVNAELDNLYAEGIPKVTTTSFTYTSADIGYDIGASVKDVYTVQCKGYSLNEFLDVDGWALERNQDTSVFASGNALFLRGDGMLEGQEVWVTYFAALTHLSTLSDVVETVSGLSSTAVDLLALGAAVGLLAGRETGRNFNESQGSTRRAQEVPPGAELGGYRSLMQRYLFRLNQEKERMRREYPPRRRR